ncbi:contractile injection system protein, VgrG/Pvc8 family [Nannocystis pusilla]|uniref:Contractile injection system protein, VgrG/Pvc8 family n=1 Tax=Nannocystis pusilla TaxID=889268 RepID=A0A9X3F0Z1_9BACT|nr:contractile injection system protein, VgrG/Pvc8 family [Nannocystis pusilla]
MNRWRSRRPRSTTPSLEQYDFPGEYQFPGRAGPHQGQAMARIRLEAHQATRRQAVGTSDCPRLYAGP